MREVRSRLLRPLQVAGAIASLLAIVVFAAAMASFFSRASPANATGTEGLVMDRSPPGDMLIEGDHGLGAWTIYVTYNPSVVEVVDCSGQGMTCEAVAVDTVRLTGTSKQCVDTLLAVEFTGSGSDLTAGHGVAPSSSAATLDQNPVYGFVVAYDEGHGGSISTDSAATTDGVSDRITGQGSNNAAESSMGTGALVSVVSALGIIVLALGLFAMVCLQPLRLFAESGTLTPTSPPPPSTTGHRLHDEEGRATTERVR